MVKIIDNYSDKTYEIKFNLFQRFHMIFIDKIKIKEILSFNGNYYYLPKENIFLHIDRNGVLKYINDNDYKINVDNRIHDLKKEIEVLRSEYSVLAQRNEYLEYWFDEVNKNGKNK
jgi:hypothetical protein